MTRARWGWLVGILLVLAVAAWFGYSLVTAKRAADTFRADAEQTAAAARALDTAALADDLPTLRASADQFVAATSGPQWTAMSVLPVVGATVSSVRDLAAAGQAAAAATSAFEPVLPRLSVEQLRSPDGRIDTATLADLAQASRAAVPQLTAAADSVNAADPGALGPVGAAVVSAQDQLGGLPQTAQQVADGLDLTGQILTAPQPTTWMVMLQNGSEARGTGGFLGAYALVRVHDGRFEVDTVDTNNSLDTAIPNRDMPGEFLDLWSVEYTAEWNSYNLSRHFPYTGQLTANGMAARGEQLAGVVAIDAHVVAALMAGTGPITAGADTVTSGDAVDFFYRGVYERYPDVAQKDAVVVALMEALLDQVTTGAFNVGTAAAALGPTIEQGRVSMWAQDPALQGRIEAFSVAGIVPQEPQPWVATSINNSAANKLDTFLASDVAYTADTCGGTSTVTVSLTNNANGMEPQYVAGNVIGAEPGTNRSWVAVYGPVGAQFDSARIDGNRQFVSEGYERGHPVWRYNISIPPGGTSHLVITFREATGATEATEAADAVGATPTVMTQAMAVPQRTSTRSVCGR